MIMCSTMKQQQQILICVITFLVVSLRWNVVPVDSFSVGTTTTTTINCLGRTQQQTQQPNTYNNNNVPILHSQRQQQQPQQFSNTCSSQKRQRSGVILFSSSDSVTTTATTTNNDDDDVVVGSSSSTNLNELNSSIQKCLDILYEAADTKQVDSDMVYTSLVDLEKLARQRAKLTYPMDATEMLQNLNGNWRLIFTTGTANTQKRSGGARINYFPIKAIQSFQTNTNDNDNPMLIENGIYLGDFNIIQFRGTMEFELKKRKLEFDFDHVKLFNTFDIILKKGEAASIGAQTGLGSESNVINVKEKNKAAFFNWISADEKIATARGGGGGLALWKRI